MDYEEQTLSLEWFTKRYQESLWRLKRKPRELRFNRLLRLILPLSLMFLVAGCFQAPAPQPSKVPTLESQGKVWHIQTIDSDGDVGEYTSLALDSSGNPVISYHDFSNNDLKLVQCGNATCSSGNSIQTVDSDGGVGEYTSLALDSSGNPVISYYSAFLEFAFADLKLVQCGNANCSSGNTIKIVDSAGHVGQYTSLELDSSGNPVISYFDEINGNLKLIYCNDTNCNTGTVQTLDSAGLVGQYTSLELDSSGNPVISYYDSTNGNLKLAYCANANCTAGGNMSSLNSVENDGQYTSLALDSSGNPVISYTDLTNGDLKLVRCTNANCTSATNQTVDSIGDVGYFTSLVLDSRGNPVISYFDNTNGDLKLVRCGNIACSSGNLIETIDSVGVVGWYTSLALDSSGNPVISYYDITNGDLKIARLVDGPTGVTINQSSGQSDPATSNPVVFTAVFDEPVTGFTGSDVSLSGTANVSGATISVTGGPSTYTISVDGLAGNGTVIASIPANVVTTGAGNGNTASTSTDNAITFSADAIRVFGTSGDEFGYSVATLGGTAGVIVIGSTEGSLNGSNLGSNDGFIHRYRGGPTWARQFGTRSNDQGTDVAVDSSRNSYVLGNTSGALGFQVGGQDVFLRKYSPAGAVIWVRQFGTNAFDEAIDIVVKGSDIYTLSQEGDSSYKVRKWDSNGNLVQTIRNSNFSQFPIALAVDSLAKVYVLTSYNNGFELVARLVIYNSTGSLAGAPTVYNGDGLLSTYDLIIDSLDSLYISVLDDIAGKGAYLRKLTSTGTAVWTRRLEPTTLNDAVVTPYALAVDGANSVYVAGSIDEQAFPGFSNQGNKDMFVRKYSSTGGLRWTFQRGGNFNDEAFGIAVSNLVYITGVTESDPNLAGGTANGFYDAFLLRLSPARGSLYVQ